MGVIFVGGVYAVGKTTACESAERVTGLRRFSASDLIRNEKAEAIPMTGKIVANVAENQELLIRGVRRVVSDHGRIILDGHFTIQNSDRQVESVATQIFSEIGVICAAVFHDEPAAIAERYRSRDGESISAEFVAEHQDAEMSHARSVAQMLGVPLRLLRAFDTDGLIDLVNSICEA